MNMLAKWAMAVTLVGPCSAFGAQVQYDLNFTVGGQTVTGYIITDGNTGALTLADIIGGMITDTYGTFAVAFTNEFASGLGLEVVGTALVFDPVGLGLPCSSDCGVEFEGPAPAGELAQLLFDPRHPLSTQLELDLRSSTNSLTTTTAAYPSGGVTLGTAVPLPVTVTLACPAAIAQVGASYSSALTAAGGVPPYTFSNTGNLPGGLTLNASTGTITGTPTTAGAFSFTAKVVDSSGLATGTVTSNCAIAVSPPPVSQKLTALLQEVTGVGPGRSLADKVTAAQAYYAAADTQATCAMLTGLVNEVRAQNGKKISQQLDAKIITDTQTIESAIGCQ
jgi:hypothetical protein